MWHLFKSGVTIVIEEVNNHRGCGLMKMWAVSNQGNMVLSMQYFFICSPNICNESMESMYCTLHTVNESLNFVFSAF